MRKRLLGQIPVYYKQVHLTGEGRFLTGTLFTLSGDLDYLSMETQ